MAWRGRAFLDLLHHVHVHRRVQGAVRDPNPTEREGSRSGTQQAQWVCQCFVWKDFLQVSGGDEIENN